MLTHIPLVHVAVAWMVPAGSPRPGGSRARVPPELLSACYWAELVVEAERGLLDFATSGDALRLQSADRTRPDERTDQVRGRLGAVLTAARWRRWPGPSG